MARRAARIDANQPEIVAALRGVGASVTPTHTAGAGFPDLVVGYRRLNYLMEVKDGDKPPSARKLTDVQEIWFDDWRGQVAIVKNIDEALAVLGIVKSEDTK